MYFNNIWIHNTGVGIPNLFYMTYIYFYFYVLQIHIFRHIFTLHLNIYIYFMFVQKSAL